MSGRRTMLPDALIRLVSRLLLAQAGAAAAIGLSYSRRHVPGLVVTIVVAVVVASLAVLIRSGGYAAWLTAVCTESGFVAIGLFRFASARYMGGSLLAIVTLGTLLHPAVAGAFAGAGQRQPAAADLGVVADSGAEARRGSAIS
jgi:hypothetical protein